MTKRPYCGLHFFVLSDPGCLWCPRWHGHHDGYHPIPSSAGISGAIREEKIAGQQQNGGRNPRGRLL